MADCRIALCDGNPDDLERFARLCRAICKKRELPATVVTFANSQELIFELGDPVCCDRVDILVIEPESVGQAAVSYIRGKLEYNGVLLYLSHSTDERYFYGAFDAKAFSFVKKSDTGRFSAVFAQALELARAREHLFIALSFNGEYRNIDVRDIYYFEMTVSHRVRVKYAGGEFSFLASLAELEDRLKDYGFLRTHRSFLVSMHEILRISFGEITLSNGETLPATRSAGAELKAAMEKWRGSGAVFVSGRSA